MGLTFVVGVPRSGTTLLRVLLDSHPQVAGAPETPWILGGYGPPGSVRELFSFAAEHSRGAVANLPGVTREVVAQSAVGFVEGVMDAYRRAEGKEHVVLKTPNDIEHLELLLELFAGAKYLHIYRDGRDIACSTVGVEQWGSSLGSYGRRTIWSAMRRWCDWESKARRLFSEHQEVEVWRLSYEELVTEPVKVLAGVCRFIGVQFDASMLEYGRFRHSYPSWEAGSADVERRALVHQQSVGRWKREIDPPDLLEMDLRYGDFLVELGYPLARQELALDGADPLRWQRYASRVRRRSAEALWSSRRALSKLRRRFPAVQGRGEKGQNGPAAAKHP